MACRPSHLYERRPKPAVALRRFAALPLAGALAVARTHSRPRRQVSGAGELVHINADFRQNVLGSARVNPCNRRQSLHRLFQRGRQHLDNPRTQASDQRLHVRQLVQQQLQQEAVVFRHPALQGQTQRGNLGTQLPTRQLGQRRRLRFARDERTQHIPAGDAQHVARHRTQLNVGVFQHLLNAVGDRRLRLDQLPSLPRQLAQVPLRCGRHKTSLQQSVLEQLRDPLRILNVGLAPWYLFDVLRVDQQDLELIFQQVPDRLPVDPRRFHGQMRYLLLGQPVGQCQQRASHRTEGARLLLHLALGIPAAYADHHRILVNVQTSARRVQQVHGGGSWRLSPGRQRAAEQSALRALPRREATVSGTRRCPSQTDTRAQSTKNIPTLSRRESSSRIP